MQIEGVETTADLRDFALFRSTPKPRKDSVMTIDVTRQHDVSILKPSGKLLTDKDVRSLKKSIYNEIPKSDPPKLLIDFDGVRMISSIGLGAIMEAGMTVKKKGGRIAVVHISSHIKSLLVMSHLMSHFEHFNSEHEGVVALAS